VANPQQEILPPLPESQQPPATANPAQPPSSDPNPQAGQSAQPPN
jgi:hypothetical protein